MPNPIVDNPVGKPVDSPMPKVRGLTKVSFCGRIYIMVKLYREERGV